MLSCNNLVYQVLPYIDPLKIWRLIHDQQGSIFLDSNQNSEHYGRYSYLVFNPIKVFTPGDNLLQNQLSEFERLKNSLAFNDLELPPFIGGLVGYLSYDLNSQLEPVLDTKKVLPTVPMYWLGLYDQVIACDHLQEKCYLITINITNNNDEYQLREKINKLKQIYDQAKDLFLAPPKNILPKISLHSNFTQLEYEQIIEQAVGYILNGDIFEVNLAQCFSGEVPENYDSAVLYQKLRIINSAPFSAYLNLGELKVLSASPERFLQVTGRNIETRPIKGTIRQSKNQQIDQEYISELETSPKQRAENIMIVDLMRNDLSKICEPTSINVSQLCKVETFTNLHHLVSVIQGVLKSSTQIYDIIQACFPGGSISGAPKIRAMQIISELEQLARGVYCGNIGYFSLNGNIDLSIAIRTIVINKRQLSFHVGGAVTLQSSPDDEYYETLLKGQKMVEAINA